MKFIPKRELMGFAHCFVPFHLTLNARAKTLQERLNSQKKLNTFEFAAFFKSPYMPRLGKKDVYFQNVNKRNEKNFQLQSLENCNILTIGSM